MPGTYTAAVTVYPNSVVSVRSNNGTSYNDIQNSMGSTVYGVKSAYIKANSNRQLLQPINFQKYDSNGNIAIFNQVTAIDPYQKQTSLEVDLREHGMVFDGNLFLTLPLLPLETVFLYFTVLEAEQSEWLPGDTMFTKTEFFREFYQRIGYEL